MIPLNYVPVIINLFHTSLLAGHQDPMKNIPTNQEIFCKPEMLGKLQLCVKSCDLCQTMEAKHKTNVLLHVWIPIENNPVQNLSVDIKLMSVDIKLMLKCMQGYRYALFTCEITNFVIVVP